MRILALILISYLSLLSSCKETPPEPLSNKPAVNPVDKDVQDQLDKFEIPVKEFKKKAAEITEKNATIKNTNEILKLGSNIRDEITRAKDHLIAKWKAAGNTTKKADELIALRKEIADEEQKVIDILSKNITPEQIAQEAQNNDALINNQLATIKNIKPLETVTGLENCGNTCFMNSIFQALFHTPELNRFLQLPLQDMPFAKDVSRDESLTKILREVFNNYMQSGQKAVRPQELTDAREMFFPQFPKGQQDDAQEFLVAFITQLGKEFNVAESLRITLSDAFKNKFENSENFNKAGGSEYSLLDRWFGGYEKSVLTKNNGKKEIRYVPFQSLTLRFPDPKQKDVSLDDMYKYYTNLEILADSPGNKDRTLSIQKSPQNLIVQLGRFKGKEKTARIDTKVTYPLQWDLKTEEGQIAYELYAVVLQSGSLSGGHYTADVKAGNQWYHADDSQKEKITQADVLGDKNKSNAYLLFYRKK